MKKITVVSLAVVFVLALFGTALAQDMAGMDEVKAKVQEAVKLAQEKGVDEAFKAIKAEGSPYVWKDTYVFAFDFETQKVTAHPVTPALEGKDLMGLKDVNGKMFFAEFINVAKEKGEGVVDYMWPKPGDKTPVPKKTYVLRVPDTNVCMAAGTYE